MNDSKFWIEILKTAPELPVNIIPKFPTQIEGFNLAISWGKVTNLISQIEGGWNKRGKFRGPPGSRSLDSVLRQYASRFLP